MSKTPTTLIIMDGFGVWDERAGNAIAAARTPNLPPANKAPYKESHMSGKA